MLTSSTASPSTVTAVMSPSRRSSRLIVSRHRAVIAISISARLRGAMLGADIKQPGEVVFPGRLRVRGDVSRLHGVPRRRLEDLAEAQCGVVGERGPTADPLAEHRGFPGAGPRPPRPGPGSTGSGAWSPR